MTITTVYCLEGRSLQSSFLLALTIFLCPLPVFPSLRGDGINVLLRAEHSALTCSQHPLHPSVNLPSSSSLLESEVSLIKAGVGIVFGYEHAFRRWVDTHLVKQQS